MCQLCVELPASLTVLCAAFPFLKAKISAWYGAHKLHHLRTLGGL